MNLVIFIDGASRGNPGLASSAAVIKKGAQVIKQKGVFYAKLTNNQAEFLALELALDEAEKLGAKEIDIFSDSQLLVRQFNGEYKIKNAELAGILFRIMGKARNFERTTLTHIEREKNKLADKLANDTIDAALHKRKLSCE